jgi:hypothetical protein
MAYDALEMSVSSKFGRRRPSRSRPDRRPAHFEDDGLGTVGEVHYISHILVVGLRMRLAVHGQKLRTRSEYSHLLHHRDTDYDALRHLSEWLKAEYRRTIS